MKEDTKNDTTKIQRMTVVPIKNDMPTNWMTWKKQTNFQKRDLPTLYQKEIQNLNILIMRKEIESIIKNFPTTKSQVKMASLVNSTKHFKKN